MERLTPTEDIRAARHRLAAKFDNDLQRIVADLRRQEAESDAEFVTLGGGPSFARRCAVVPRNHDSPHQ